MWRKRAEPGLVEDWHDVLVGDAEGRAQVFMSYAHGDTAHEDAVGRLYELLRSGGVDPVLDRDYEGPGVQWPDWMERQVTDTDFVLVIASPGYGRQAEADVDIADITGRGTWYEARLLRDLVYRDQGRESLRRILPVLLPGGSAEDIPLFFAPYGGTYFRVRQLDQTGVAGLLGVLCRETHPRTGAGFEPLRHGVGIDVRVAADGWDSQIAIAGQVLGTRHRPVPAGLAGVWSVLDLNPLTAVGELAAAGDRLAQTLFDPEWWEQVRRLVDTRPVGAPVEGHRHHGRAGVAA